MDGLGMVLGLMVVRLLVLMRVRLLAELNMLRVKVVGAVGRVERGVGRSRCHRDVVLLLVGRDGDAKVVVKSVRGAAVLRFPVVLGGPSWGEKER